MSPLNLGEASKLRSGNTEQHEVPFSNLGKSTCRVELPSVYRRDYEW